MVQITNAAFTEPLDICKRVADHLGQTHPLTITDDSKLVTLFNNAYPKLRQAELRRNIWRFSVRKAALRPLNTAQFVLPNGKVILPTMQITPPTWDVATTYLFGSIVNYGSALWLNTSTSSLAQIPGTAGSGWTNYFGTICVNAYDSTTKYFSGEMVYESTGIGTYKVYLALLNGANEDPSVDTAYDATRTYAKDEIVDSASINYKSLVDMNLNNTPVSNPTAWEVTSLTNSVQWVQIVGAVLSSINLIYPIGSGPAIQTATRNVFTLPYGFMRQAPQDPKAGAVSFLGGPSGLSYDDWEFEGNYFTSRCSTPILFRFAADVVDVSTMDSMFAEGLSLRIGYALCEAVTQSTEKLKNITGSYGKNMVEARTVNGIEEGPVEAPTDDWIECRK